LKYPAQAIILLGDGAPTDHRIDVILGEVIQVIGGRMEINTVAIGGGDNSPAGGYFRQTLAKHSRRASTGALG
jgi:hypothetical protein